MPENRGPNQAWTKSTFILNHNINEVEHKQNNCMIKKYMAKPSNITASKIIYAYKLHVPRPEFIVDREEDFSCSIL